MKLVTLIAALSCVILNAQNFQIVDGSFTWKQAKQDAEARGGRLAVLKTQAKIDAANSYIATLGPYAPTLLWIGLTDEESEGEWKWIDGSVLDTHNWGIGEPNNSSGNEHYAHLQSSFTWNDLPESWGLSYLLELYETTDSDGDGVGDNSDAFPSDPNETTDSDGDGVGDNSDAFPSDPNETTDSDGDGVGDNLITEEDIATSIDMDMDGVSDNLDAFPYDADETTDSDGDGVGDNSDAFPSDPNETTDSDGDGVGDNSDAFPSDPNETTDSDGDGVGDNSDAFPYPSWVPDGWVYYEWPYAYSFSEGRWHYFNESDNQWLVNLTSVEWGTLDAASGWNYYAWPYSYSFDEGAWHWYNNDTQWVVDLFTGEWKTFGRFGQETYQEPFAVIAKSGEVKWWEYEVSAPISFSAGGDSYTVYTSGPIRFEHNGNTNIRSISLSGSFNANVQGQSISGNLNVIISEKFSEQGAELFLDGGDITLDMSYKLFGVNVSSTSKGDFAYSSPISASYSPIFRNNLWDLKVGYTETYDVAASMSGYATASVPGYGTEIENFSDYITGTESWRIIAKYDTYKLNGRTYSKVVHVRRNGYGLSPNSQELVQEEGDIWLAEGIGMIETNVISGVYIIDSLKLKRSSEL